MLRQVIANTRVSVRQPECARFLSTTRQLFTKDHLKKDQNATEKAEQKMFDENQKDLEQLEHGKSTKSHNYKCDDLREKGENARIEQNRPDDGVY